MENIILFPIPLSQIRELIREEMRFVLQEESNQVHSSQPEPNEILTIDKASQFVSLAKATIYELTSKRQIPFFKKGKKLYFSKQELQTWILEGKKKTTAEIDLEVKKYSKNKNH
ncbi:helix-turn-helix domain-containing protein [Cytophagaceae bacterium YF14B1]|uniref:Helix-turn-helix domain-containing protein n=1 Tax=Xanthocytophaga flava TaxID=3048013 RepID=A0AAE3UA09_9BACT|nr:helix-turn-helix domain-containing protein [Xanthocytophaga flavus]MDJ1484232.1 helix-turn-helix domain-containing protein [Xanthocytophaga flavus]